MAKVGTSGMKVYRIKSEDVLMNKLEIQQHFEKLFIRAQESLGDLETDDVIPPVDLWEIFPDFWDEWFNPILEAWTPEVHRELRGFLFDLLQARPGDLVTRWVALAIYDGLIQYLTSSPWSYEWAENHQAPDIKVFTMISEVSPSSGESQ